MDTNGAPARSPPEYQPDTHFQATARPSDQEAAHHSEDSSRSQDGANIHRQNDETNKLMVSQAHVHTRPALDDEKQNPMSVVKAASWYSDWGIEIASIILGMAVLIGMAVFLFWIRGRLLTSWKIMINPNTMLSVLSTAFKAATLLAVASSIGQLKWIYFSKTSLGLEQLQSYDDATRGPWGALLFVWKARRYGSLVAYIGCIITIAAIALDPFSQEMLSFDPAPTQLEGVSSSVPRSQIYQVAQGVNRVEDSSTLHLHDTLLQQAASNGLYNSTISTAPFVCPGSNCTYPSFTSLGIYGTCADVTARTSHQCVDDLSTQLCDYAIPNGLRLSAQGFKSRSEVYSYTLINTSLTGGIFHTNSMDGMSLLDVGIVTFDSTSNGVTQNFWNETIQAFQCHFEIVAYIYSNWASTNGTINTAPLAWSPLSPIEDGPDSLQMLNATSQKFPEGQNRTFLVSGYDLENMFSILLNVFGHPSTDNYASSKAMYLNALYNSANLTETAQNIAMAMSFRMLQGPNATFVYGSVYEMQTYIRVHWGWLALSVTLLLLACVVLGFTIAISRKVNVKASKSSLDPFLYGTDEVVNFASSAEDPGINSAEDSQDTRKQTIAQYSR